MKTFPTKLLPGRSVFYAPFVPSKYSLRSNLLAHIDRVVGEKSIKKFVSEQVYTIRRHYKNEAFLTFKPPATAIADAKTILFFHDIVCY